MLWLCLPAPLSLFKAGADKDEAPSLPSAIISLNTFKADDAEM